MLAGVVSIVKDYFSILFDTLGDSCFRPLILAYPVSPCQVLFQTPDKFIHESGWPNC